MVWGLGFWDFWGLKPHGLAIVLTIVGAADHAPGS